MMEKIPRNIWAILKRRLHVWHPRLEHTRGGLKEDIEEAAIHCWEYVDPEHCQGPKRVQAIIKAKG